MVSSPVDSEENTSLSDSGDAPSGAEHSGVRHDTGGSSGGSLRGAPVTIEAAPRRVGKYKIVAQLGRGGMANVFLAAASGVGGVTKLVVLKALLPEMEMEPEAVTMFLEEARLAAQLNHANVVQTYEVGTEGGRHVIVMEYLEGQSLWSVIKRGAAEGRTMPLRMQLRIVSNVLEGLHYAHELCSYDGTALGLVHRDVSPQNIFLTYDGQVKVLDFGIAKVTNSSTQTATGILKGKLAYMAPEQIIGEGIDRRADVFSVGCILWSIAAGVKLWKGVSDVQLMQRVLANEIPSPQDTNPSCDDELTRIIMKALECDREARYATALELQADLDAYCAGLGSPVTAKQIGTHVAGLFADRRQEIRAIVEQQLTKLAQEDTGGATALPVIGENIGGLSQSGANQSASVVVQGARPWWPWALGAIALALVPLGYRWLEAPKPPPVITVAEAPPAPPAPVSVTLQFHAEPAHARLYLDDALLPSNPTAKVLLVDEQVHQLRVEADGYESVVQEFTVTGDDSFKIELSKRPEPKPAPTSPQVVAPTVKRAPQPKTPDCSAPFVIDAQGVKRIRPECL